MSARQIKTVSCMIVLLFILSIVTGCSTTGSLTIHKSVEGKTIKGTAVVLTVTPPNAKGNNVAIQLKGQVVIQLLGAGLFKSITGEGDQDANYNIFIKLTEINEVSGVSRVMWGAMAGSNKIAGDVTVIDVKSGQSVRSFSFRGESASHPFSGKSDIKDAINEASEEIIKGLS